MANQSEGQGAMNFENDKGIVIAFHCVPASIAPEIEELWSTLQKDLWAQSQQLLLISSTAIRNPNLLHIRVPYELPKYPASKSPTDYQSNHHLVEGLESWYRLNKEQAKNVYGKAKNFYSELLDIAQPAAVISWQSMNPASRIVREACAARGIPWWCSERGWVRGTLMIDTAENNFLSESTVSLTLQKIYKKYLPNESLINRYKKKTDALATIARYPSQKQVHVSSLRSSLKIPRNSKIYVFMNHGEPHVGAMNSLFGLQNQHELRPGQLQSTIDHIARHLASRGDYLIIKEHPFNVKHSRTIATEHLPNTWTIDTSLEAIDDEADGYFFTLSTLQFEIALKGRRFGLLSRGPLSNFAAAPCLHDFTTIEAFLHEIENSNAWEKRSKEIERRISFYLEHLLLDLEKEHLAESSKIIADHLQQFNGLESGTALTQLLAWINGHTT